MRTLDLIRNFTNHAFHKKVTEKEDRGRLKDVRVLARCSSVIHVHAPPLRIASGQECEG